MKNCLPQLKGRLLWTMMSIMAGSIINSCGGDETPTLSETPENKNEIMTVSPDTLYLKADGKEKGSFQVKLKKTGSFFAKAEKDWCKLDNADGSGGSAYTVSVTPEPNTQTESRTSRISFYSGECTEYAYVVQEAAEKAKEMTITPDTLYLDGVIGNKGTVTVHLMDNATYYLGETSHFGREVIEEEDGKILKIHYTVIREYNDDITIKMSVQQHGIQKFYYVCQKAKKQEVEDQYNITISPNAHDVGARGGEVFSLIDLDRESTVTVTSDAVWCAPRNGNFENSSTQFKLYIQVYPNSKDQSRTATVTVKAGSSIQTCTITQQAGDGNLSIGGVVAKAVDLGLSVKWATHNLGASKEDEVGAYFSWGEVNPKSSYGLENYKYYNKTYATYTDLGDNISGTQYDAATIHWGDEWRMPTKDEMQEFYEKCKVEWTRVNDMNGVKITGPNGNSIFLPAGGDTSYKPSDKNDKVSIWSGTIIPNNKANAYSLSITSTFKGYGLSSRSNGAPIRPVTKSSNSEQAGGGIIEAE